MKLDQINVSGYLGIHDVKIKCDAPVMLVAGSNGSGKSSLRDAINHALTGNPSRVNLKKDFSRILPDGHKDGYAEVISGEETYCISIPGGEGNHHESNVLPYVLNAQSFASMDEKEKRSFLFGLVDIKLGPDAVIKKLVDRKCNTEKSGQIRTVIASGFAEAEKYAKSKATEYKGSWKQTTGETWGSEKGGTWKPEEPESSLDAAEENVANFSKRIAEIEEELDQKNKMFGAAQQRLNDAPTEEDIEKLQKQAASIGRLQNKLELDMANQHRVETELAELKAAYKKSAEPEPLMKALAEDVSSMLSIIAVTSGLVDGDGVINKWGDYQDVIDGMNAHISDYDNAFNVSSSQSKDDAVKISNHETSLRLMINSVSNCHRDIAAAKEAELKLKANSDKPAADGESPNKVQADIVELKRKLAYWKEDRDKNQQIVDGHKSRERRISVADDCHKNILEWLKIADALSPSGIPGEMLSHAVAPINERLLSTATESWMIRAEINTDMSICASKNNGKKIPYQLLSESEQWRVDAMIAEAIAHVSGIRTLMLDRFDVLDIEGRADFVYWLEGLADGGIDTCIVFGTMKSAPKGLPDCIDVHWLQNGEEILLNEQKAA